MKRIILVFIMLAAARIHAQEYKFGDVTMDELKEEKYGMFPEASAAILYEHRETYIQVTTNTVELITEMYKKIKIYNKDGFENATQVINLFKANNEGENVRKIKAVTYNLEGDKIAEYKLEKNQIFTDEISESHRQVKFTMPSVKEGSVVEIYYEVGSPFIWYLDDVVFQHDIPIKKFFAEVRTPEDYHFNRTMKGFLNINSVKTSKLDHRLGMTVEVYQYSQTNLPPLKEEPYVDNINNYRGAIMYELAYVQTRTSLHTYSQTWNDVAKKIGDASDYKTDLDKGRVVDEIVAPLIAGKSDPVEKMKILFNYVKANFAWNENNGKYFENGLKQTLKDKKGNVADLNLMLVAMLRYAGIDANPVIISTKDNMIPLFPTLDRLNYVIAHAQIGEDEYLMDATRKFSEVNVLPVNDYNWEGLYINNNKSDWKKIALRQPDQSFESIDIMCTLSADGSTEGKMRYTYDKHDAMYFRGRFKSKGQEVYIKDKESALNGIEISDYKAVNTDAGEKRANESFSFFYEDAAEVIGGKLYFDPFLFLSRKESPFVTEKREFPIDFGYPFENKYNVNITIPEGYQIEHVPQSLVLRLPDDLGEVKYLINTSATGVQLIYNLKINFAMLSPIYYNHIKEFFSKMVEVETEKIILSKV